MYPMELVRSSRSVFRTAALQEHMRGGDIPIYEVITEITGEGSMWIKGYPFPTGEKRLAFVTLVYELLQFTGQASPWCVNHEDYGIVMPRGLDHKWIRDAQQGELYAHISYDLDSAAITHDETVKKATYDDRGFMPFMERIAFYGQGATYD